MKNSTTAVYSKKLSLASTKSITLCAIFITLFIVGAKIIIPLPFVPVSGIMFFVCFCIMSLPAKLSLTAISGYIILGLIGLPIFSAGGGISYLLKPSFGYILGFLLASIVSIIVKKNVKKRQLFVLSCTNILCIYTCGLLYTFLLSTFYFDKSVDIGFLILNGALIFLPSDIMWQFIASTTTKKIKKFI